jgi:rubredoxin
MNEAEAEIETDCEHWCSSCGFVGESRIIDEHFGQLCSNNFWGDYSKTIECPKCGAEEVISSVWDGVEVSELHYDNGVLYDLAHEKVQEFNEKLDCLTDKVNKDAQSDKVIQEVMRKLCINGLEQEVSEIIILQEKDGFSTPKTVIKAADYSAVDDVVQEVIDNHYSKYSSINIEVIPTYTEQIPLEQL